MPLDFLVEVGTEELPPTALKGLAQAFGDGIEAELRKREFAYAQAGVFATPRRLAVRVRQLAEQAPDRTIELLGPPVAAAKDKGGNWSKAAVGFASKNGVKPEQLTEAESPKGPRLAFRETRKGEQASACVAEIVERALAALPIPKRMRWGASRAEFVRPVHWLLMLLGERVVDAELFGLKAGRQTMGHRFHSKGWIEVPDPLAYESILEDKGRVIPAFDRRRQMIQEQVAAEAGKLDAEVVVDPELLDEVTGLVELPVALTGSFDKAFLDVPAEALVSSMKEHQKYFHVVNDEGALLPNFVFISNIESRDSAQVVEGNERVIRPRLSDAAFFFETDKKTRLEDRVEPLGNIVFQEKLGSLLDKTRRVKKVAGFIAERIGCDADQAERAAWLAKADLASEMVLEFDNLQGIAGSYYARHDGEPEQVAQAIREQYLPRFAGDDLPASLTGCALALADRLDTLVGIFGIGQPPTGSKDPFALRRASLAVLRILVEKQLPLDLAELLESARDNFDGLPANDNVVNEVLGYMIERFRAWYEEAGIPVQVFQAVSARNITVPLDFDSRVKAVHRFSQLPEAQALAAANKRVSNILAKQGGAAASKLDTGLLKENAEQKLAQSLAQKQEETLPLFAGQKYTEGLESLASLREGVDAFFDSVMVMTEDEALRGNRLALLQQLRDLFLQVADISQLSNA
ncbi:glycine--tRNA ligase subunit beta [Gilvimarinus sp. F26214L]|uniref:glycine--tRNA ligase subunit beta n=1 Tax=Gilvimarinus sp. DZF01 TaxID=3461371 RepID=UPI0040460955